MHPRELRTHGGWPMSEGRKRVGVVPPAAFAARGRLWSALEQAFAVNCEPRDARHLGSLDAAIFDGEETPANVSVPTLRAYAPERRGTAESVRLAHSHQLPRCLRGQRLKDGCSSRLLPVKLGPTETVLAARHGEALWVIDEVRSRQRVAALPDELAVDEVLRDRLKAGRFLALLPLVLMLRALTGEDGWTAPALRAAVVLDDPNLHRTSYGYVDYAELAHRARRGSFHVAFAIVPLDAWYASARAATLVGQDPRLSLLIHGNDHSFCELGRLTTEESSLAAVAQAVRRVRDLERRTGIEVARVMAPPHGECSPAVLRALRRAGFLAACISRPYPWLDRPPGDHVLAQWGLADMVDGLPILGRYSLTSSREELPLKALLHQPLILYGHQRDIAGEHAPLEEATADVNALGEVHWCGLRSIARSNFLTRPENDLLRVRMFTREADLVLPASIKRIAIEVPGNDEQGRREERVQLAAFGWSAIAPTDRSVDVPHVDGPLRVRLASVDAVSVDEVPTPRRRAWPPVRRFLTEGRDRLTPSLDALGTASRRRSSSTAGRTSVAAGPREATRL